MRFLPSVSLLLFCLAGRSAVAAELYYIDAHSQIDQFVAPDTVIQRMNQAGIYRTILSARGKRRPSEIADLAARYPERIVPAVRTKGRDYRKNNKQFYRKLQRQVDSGRFNAMAEVLLYHAQKGDAAPEIVVEPDDPRVQAALDAAIANTWPFVVHIEFAALSSRKRKKFMEGLGEMMAAHPQHPFLLIHMGQLGVADVRRLIERYKNLYFLTSHANPVTGQRSKQPWVNLFKGKTLAPQWKELLIQYPRRFVFALDNVFALHWHDEIPRVMDYGEKAMAELPRDVAQAVAHGNAERLWRLPPKASPTFP